MVRVSILRVAGAVLLLAACVSQQKYDASQQKNSELETRIPAAQPVDERGGRGQERADFAAAECHQSLSQQRAAVSVGRLGDAGRGEGDHRQDSGDPRAPQTTKVNVNGYTDSTPIGPGLMKRGRHVQPHPLAETRRQRHAVPDRAGRQPRAGRVHGYGDADPVASNATPAGRAQNRRVELTVASLAK